MRKGIQMYFIYLEANARLREAEGASSKDNLNILLFVVDRQHAPEIPYRDAIPIHLAKMPITSNYKQNYISHLSTSNEH